MTAVIGQPAPGGFPAGNARMYINGVRIVIDATGDGIDIDDSIELTAGTVIVSGPISNANEAIEYDDTFKVTGG